MYEIGIEKFSRKNLVLIRLYSVQNADLDLMYQFGIKIIYLKVQKFSMDSPFQDMILRSPPRFARIQYELLNAFLERSLFDQNEEWPVRSNVIPNELVTSLM